MLQEEDKKMKQMIDLRITQDLIRELVKDT